MFNLLFSSEKQVVSELTFIPPRRPRLVLNRKQKRCLYRSEFWELPAEKCTDYLKSFSKKAGQVITVLQ